MTRKFFLHPPPVTGNVTPFVVGVATFIERVDFVSSLRPAGSRKGCDNQRVFCSLSAAAENLVDAGHSNSYVMLVKNRTRRVAKGTHSSTQRTGGQRTNERRVDIRRRKPDGPSLLDGTAEATGKGQPNLPCGQRRKTSAPQSGGCGFLSFFPFRRLEQSPHFLGGAVLCLSFRFFVLNSFPLLRMTTWQQVQETAKRIGFQTYQDYLESDHWRELRRLKGVKCCVSCQATHSLVCHHVHYRNLLDVTVQDLVVLCKDCHDDFHMACRHFDVDYIGVSQPLIVDAVADFRKTAWYAKWIAKRQRKMVNGKHVQQVAIAEFWVVGIRGSARFDITAVALPRKVANQCQSRAAKYFKSVKTKVIVERRPS